MGEQHLSKQVPFRELEQLKVQMKPSEFKNPELSAHEWDQSTSSYQNTQPLTHTVTQHCLGWRVGKVLCLGNGLAGDLAVAHV